MSGKKLGKPVLKRKLAPELAGLFRGIPSGMRENLGRLQVNVKCVERNEQQQTES